jgi:hypothetical protein
MQKALKTLEIKNIDKITWKIIKQQFRILALKYHPDKNNSEDANIRFREIKEAYDYLEEKWKDKDEIITEENTNKYQEILNYILESFLVNNDRINSVLEKLLSVCETQSIQILEKIDIRKFRIMYSILKKYKTIFLLSDFFYEELERIYTEKNGYIETIQLKPTINDLWDHLVYKLVKDDELYLVPLWHQELVYEHNGNEFKVECILNPENENIWIDDDNNIHQQVMFNINEILEISKKRDSIKIMYGYKIFTIHAHTLYIKPYQIIKWAYEGISKISNDIQNISKKTDVYLHVYLE